MNKRRSVPSQGDLFRPALMISGATNASGLDVWYDRKRLNWTTDPAELLMTDAELRAHRARQAQAFDAACDAWK